MSLVTVHELAQLRSLGQRFRLYFARWGTFQIQQSTPLLADASTDPPTIIDLGIVNNAEFDPIINIGPHRLAFVDEPIEFDASRSFRAHHIDPVDDADWTFESGSITIAGGLGPHSVSWSDPGLYDVTCTVSGYTVRRWVRVLRDRRLSTTWDIVSVNSVSGATSGGWKADVVIAPPSDISPTSTRATVDIGDFQQIGIFVEEEWEQSDGSWNREPISGYAQEPRLLLQGYIEQDSIKQDANTHSVSFTIASLADQMNIGYIHGTHTWGILYASVAQASGDLPSTLPGVTLDFATNGIKMPDVIIFWLQKYTNILKYHDFMTWYDSIQSNLDEVSTQETSIWNAFGALVENEFAWWFVDPCGCLHFEPNPHIRGRTWWEGEYPTRIVFHEDDLLDIAVAEDKTRNVIWVQLTGTRTRDGKQWTSRYPASTPPGGAGSWYNKTDLLVSRQAFLDDIIADVYNDANRKITATLTCGLNRALRVPDRVRVTLDLPLRDISWDNKLFSVMGITYAIDVGLCQWRTTIQLSEFVGG